MCECASYCVYDHASVRQSIPITQVSLVLGPESDRGRSDGEFDEEGASIETSCQGRTDARRIIVKRDVVGAGMSKSSSREVYVEDRCTGTVILLTLVFVIGRYITGMEVKVV